MAFQPRLSPELWTMIFQKLSEGFYWRSGNNNIESVRLTCRLFENLATPFLLQGIYCGPLSPSLTRLTAVSCHPVFSRSVEEVIFICGRYRFIKTLPEYKEALCQAKSCRFKELKSEEENLNLEAAFSRYGQHFNDQTAMENSGEVIARLCSALMRMPNVKKITVSPNLGCYLDGCNYSRFFLEPEPAYNEAFLLMVRLLSLTGTKIRELNIEHDDDLAREGQGVDGAVIRGMSHMDLSHCCNVFRGLREVTITANMHDTDGWMTGNTAKILSAATNLESLLFGSDHGFRISLKCFFGTMTWSRLTLLNFSWVIFDQGELLDFLRRHANTLKKICLFCVVLTNGSWKILLEGMKSSLSLEDISIEELAEEDDEGVMIGNDMSQATLKDYFLGDGPHPLSDNIP